MRHGDIETFHMASAWHNRVEGDGRIIFSRPERGTAVGVGRQMAQEHQVDHIVRNPDGSIAEKDSYRSE
jgi:hypothetical protein